MAKLLFICNPYAGRGAISKKMTQILDCFVKNGFETRVHITQCAKDATNIAQMAGADFDRVVAGGGDGTLGEVIRGVMAIKKERRPTVGFIPAGTTNDIARSLAIPSDKVRAADVASRDNIIELDVGTMNDEYFSYVAGVGVFTDAAYETPQNAKRIFGPPAYAVGAFKSFTQMKPLKIKVMANGEVFETDKLLAGTVSNSYCIGGWTGRWGKDICLNDGLFEVNLVTEPKNVIAWGGTIGSILTNAGNPEAIHRLKSAEITIISEHPLKWVRDGEYGGKLQEVHIVNIPRGIRMACGRDLAKKETLLTVEENEHEPPRLEIPD